MYSVHAYCFIRNKLQYQNKSIYINIGNIGITYTHIQQS